MLFLLALVACNSGRVATDGCDCEEGGKVVPAETSGHETAADSTPHTGETGEGATDDTSSQAAAQTFEATCLCSEDNTACTIDPGWGVDGAEPIQISQLGHCNPAFSESCDWRLIASDTLDISAAGVVTVPCGDAYDWERNDAGDGYICRYTEIKIFMRRGW